MTNVVEIVLEMILLGTVDAISSRRVPMILRVLAAAVLLALYLGLFLLLYAAGAACKSTILIVLAFVVLAAGAGWTVYLAGKIRRKR